MREGLIQGGAAGARVRGSVNRPSLASITTLPAADDAKKRVRLQSLDAARGLNVLLMFFVDQAGDR